jgi:hypothetical protein
MGLIRLIYVSTLSQGIDEQEISSILEASHRRNEIDGVTGMLLYSQGNFLQVLEGEEPAVLATYARICQDRRHGEIVEIVREPAEVRDFPDWSMGFRNLSGAVAESLPEAARHFRFGFEDPEIRVKPGLALDLLRRFTQGNR